MKKILAVALGLALTLSVFAGGGKASGGGTGGASVKP